MEVVLTGFQIEFLPTAVQMSRIPGRVAWRGPDEDTRGVHVRWYKYLSADRLEA